MGHTKNYNTEVKEAWRESVWSYWRELSGMHKLPVGLQYWTLPDVILDTDGHTYGELRHLQDFGLLSKEEQFFGVCNERGKALRNLPSCGHCGALPRDHVKQGCQFYMSSSPWNALLGDIASIVPDFKKKGAFRPGIINLDTTSGKELGWELAAQVGQYCCDTPGVVMILNLIQKHRVNDHTTESIKEESNRYKCFRSATLYDPNISYKGGFNCHMRTIFLKW